MEPLAIFSVLELPGEVATRYCARLFAMLGARVVKVGTPDDSLIGYANGSGIAYGRWLDQRKSHVDRTEDARGPFDLIIAGQDAESIRNAEILQARHTNRPTLVALSWFD